MAYASAYLDLKRLLRSMCFTVPSAIRKRVFLPICFSAFVALLSQDVDGGDNGIAMTIIKVLSKLLVEFLCFSFPVVGVRGVAHAAEKLCDELHGIYFGRFGPAIQDMLMFRPMVATS